LFIHNNHMLGYIIEKHIFKYFYINNSYGDNMGLYIPDKDEWEDVLERLDTLESDNDDEEDQEEEILNDNTSSDIQL